MNKRTYRISKYFALIFLLLLTGCTARTAQTPALTDECHVANVLDAYLPAEARALGDVVVVAESPDGRTTARFLCSRAEGVILAVEITAAKGADAK